MQVPAEAVPAALAAPGGPDLPESLRNYVTRAFGTLPLTGNADAKAQVKIYALVGTGAPRVG